MVNNLLANAGDTGSVLSPGGSHMPWRTPHAVEDPTCRGALLSLCSGAQEPQLLSPQALEPVLPSKRSHRNEKPTPQLGKSPGSNKDLAQ